MWLGWVLRVLLVVIVVRAIWRFLSGVVDGASRQSQGARPPTGVPLVRDPVCGTYVVLSRALAAKHGDTTHYFCSERCRRAYDGR